MDEKLAESSSADEKEAPEPKGTPPADEESVENVPWNKDPRFKDFISKRKLLKEYEELGAPGDIAGYVQSLETRVAAMEDERKPNEPKTDEQKKREVDLKEARRQMREIDPDLSKISALEAHVEARNRSLEVRALDETAKVMGAAGLSTGQKDVKGMTNVLAEIIGGDEVLLAEYMDNPREAVRLAWKKLAAIGKSAGTDRSDTAAVQREKEKQAKLPKPHGSSGTTGTEKAEGPVKGLKDAYARSKAYLKGLE